MSNKNWIYFGVFLSGMSKAKNLIKLKSNNVVIPEDWKIFNDHMTIAFNNGSDLAIETYRYYQIYLEEPTMQDSVVSLIVDGIGISDEAIALRVKWSLPKANKISHITIAVPPGGKPVNSNKITEWRDIDEFEINGVLKTYFKK